MTVIYQKRITRFKNMFMTLKKYVPLKSSVSTLKMFDMCLKMFQRFRKKIHHVLKTVQCRSKNGPRLYGKYRKK